VALWRRRPGGVFAHQNRRQDAGATQSFHHAMDANPSSTGKVLPPLDAATPEQVAARFGELRARFDRDAAGATDENGWKSLRDAWLARKSGVLTQVTETWLKPSKSELKRAVGQALNELKAHVEAALESRRSTIEASAEQTALAREREDLSLPGVVRPLGSRHPLRQTFEEIERIFLSLGYSVVSGPEMETPYYNFEALNIPEHHPARDNMDTFYMAAPPGAALLLLRTHTSPMQVRTMEKQQPPVRIIVPGKVYRRDNPDATHGFMFHQIEGLAVDTGITFCDFKGTVEYFVREFLGPKVKTRLRPSYFPFTEPSVEVDATCVFCGGKGCNVCKQSGWIELFGAGMVDPAVYGFVNYDAKKFSGFAFGLGVERLTQLKYNINDLQLYFQNDVRFLRQFA
jgi:phenylalanyl-tRNA synthetase alpha chain